MKKDYYGDLVFMFFFLAFTGLLVYLTIPAKADKAPVKLQVSTIDSANRPLRIAVVDTGLNDSHKYRICDDDHMSFHGLAFVDEIGHGSQMVEIIDTQARKSGRDYCFVIIKALSRDKFNGVDDTRFVDAIKYLATLKNIDIVNISVEGDVYLEDEVKAIKKVLDNKTIVVAAAGNRNTKLDNKSCKAYPACDDDRIIVVSQKNGPKTNYGPKIDVSISGPFILSSGERVFGSSPATAFTTGTIMRLIK